MHPDHRGGGTIDIALACPRDFDILQCTPPHLRRTQWYVHANDSQLLSHVRCSPDHRLSPLAESVSPLRSNGQCQIRYGPNTPLSYQYSLRNPNRYLATPVSSTRSAKVLLLPSGLRTQDLPLSGASGATQLQPTKTIGVYPTKMFVNCKISKDASRGEIINQYISKLPGF